MAFLNPQVNTSLKNQAIQLFKDGYTVVPILSADYGERVLCRLKKEMASYPEYLKSSKNPDPDDLPQFVMGGFGALGNPSSFHTKTIRNLRVVLDFQARQLFRHYISENLGKNLEAPDIFEKSENSKFVHETEPNEYYLEQLFDRVCVRRAGTNLTSESWHRDKTPPEIKLPLLGSEIGKLESKKTLLNRGTIFGGWLNLDVDQTQYFSCARGSHKFDNGENEHEHFGFAQIKPSEYPKFEAKKVRVPVPPGHWIIFYQHIAHQVCPEKIQRDSFRLFAGFNFLNSKNPKPLFGIDYMSRVVEFQESVLLPSGQQPPLFAANNLSYQREKVEAWSRATFHPSLLIERTTGAKTKNPGIKYKTIPRFLTRTHIQRKKRIQKYTLKQIAAIVPKLIT